MNVWNPSCWSSVACQSPCCDWSRKIVQHTFDTSPTDSCFSFFKMVIIQAKTWDFVQLLCLFVRQFAISLNTFFEHVLPCHRTTQPSLREVFTTCNFTIAPAEVCDSNMFLYSLKKILSRWVNTKYTWSRNEVGSSSSTFFIHFFHMGAILHFSPANSMSPTYSDKNNPWFRWKTFPIRHFYPSKFQSNLLELSFPFQSS